MYLDGVNGWYQSPLYLLYQETVRRAVNDKKHLSEVVKEVGLTMDEVKAIAGVGKSLVI
jgi:hypothetical protein